MFKYHGFLVVSAITILAACGSTDDGGGGGPPGTTPDGGGGGGGTGGGTGSDAGAGDGDAGTPGSNDAGTDGAQKDAGTTPPGDGGYACAPHAPFPTETYWGGPILANPEVVTITYDDLTDATQRTALETFGDNITLSAWWDTVTAGYCDKQGRCIGHGSNGGHVVLKAETLTLTDSQTAGADKSIDAYVQTHIDSGELPEPHVDTLYAFYLSRQVTVLLDGATSCGGGYGGYHFDAKVHKKGDTNDFWVAYAILPTCGNKTTNSLVNTASHEFIEAATDAKAVGPDIRNADWGFYMEDPSWGIVWSGQEVGDLCQTGEYGTATSNGYTVTRGWLHDPPACGVPCGPGLPTDVYFGAAPEKQVIELAVGESTTVEVTGFAQNPMADFTVSMTELATVPGGTGTYGNHLQMSFTGGVKTTTLNNGMKINLTIQLLSSPPEDPNYPSQTNFRYNHAFAYLTSTSGTKRYKWAFTVREKK